MASIYDEINQIKKEGSSYDESLGTDPSSIGFGAFKKHLNSTPLNKQYLGPDFASSKFAGYGNSKYDKGLTVFDEMSDTGGSLENLRASNQP